MSDHSQPLTQQQHEPHLQQHELYTQEPPHSTEQSGPSGRWAEPTTLEGDESIGQLVHQCVYAGSETIRTTPRSRPCSAGSEGERVQLSTSQSCEKRHSCLSPRLTVQGICLEVRRTARQAVRVVFTTRRQTSHSAERPVAFFSEEKTEQGKGQENRNTSAPIEIVSLISNRGCYWLMQDCARLRRSRTLRSSRRMHTFEHGPQRVSCRRPHASYTGTAGCSRDAPACPRF